MSKNKSVGILTQNLIHIRKKKNLHQELKSSGAITKKNAIKYYFSKMQKQLIKWMSRTQSIICDFKTNNFN